MKTLTQTRGGRSGKATIDRLSRELAKRLAAPPPVLAKDPANAAKAAGLRYVFDSTPGIKRKRVGKNFTYVGPDRRTIRDAQTLKRIRSLVIPPAWQDVWISPIANGHLQATGRDARGRKQYRYHHDWRSTRDETKFGRLMEFGTALPSIRKHVDRDLKRRGLPREKVLATVVRLLETTFIRVGNEEYARTNSSFGLTTMQDHHVSVRGCRVSFKFNGKRGIFHEIDLEDCALARIVKRCRDLPGVVLFQYIDDHGRQLTIDSGDVNGYLRHISGKDFTAKDFRTWGGTVLAAIALQELQDPEHPHPLKKNVVKAVQNVSQRLGNTPAICRKCYIHPLIIDSYLDGTLFGALQKKLDQELRANEDELRPDEAAVMALLKARLNGGASRQF